MVNHYGLTDLMRLFQCLTDTDICVAAVTSYGCWNVPTSLADVTPSCSSVLRSSTGSCLSCLTCRTDCANSSMWLVLHFSYTWLCKCCHALWPNNVLIDDSRDHSHAGTSSCRKEDSRSVTVVHHIMFFEG